jgi:predicted TIM-barrel fold metal-dependent hydrolase
VTEEGDLQPVLFDIFDLVRQHDAILGTAHVSVPEIIALVREARAAGVAKVVVTHPELPWVDVPVDVQEELRDLGAAFERCYVSSIDGAPFARIVTEIRRVGLDSTVLATDFGRSPLPPPVEGMRAYVAALLAEGFTNRDIQLMAGENPSRLLGLD